MLPVVITPFNDRVLTVSRQEPRPFADGIPYILKSGVFEDNDQPRQVGVHLLDLTAGLVQHLIPVLLCQLLLGYAGIIDVLCGLQRRVDDGTVQPVFVRAQENRDGIGRS